MLEGIESVIIQEIWSNVYLRENIRSLSIQKTLVECSTFFTQSKGLLRRQRV